MGTPVEDALTALARDLLEEISAGRAIELAEAMRADPDADPVELARFNVRPFQRTTTVHGRKVVEEVGAHTAERAGMPGAGDLTGGGLEHPGGWIPEPKWQEGQKEWAAKGEAIWKQNQWKAHGKLHEGIGKTAEHIAHGPDAPRKGSTGIAIANPFGRTEAASHLRKAQEHLQEAKVTRTEDPGEHIGQAYHHLMEAHREGTEKALPHATSREERAHVEEGLKQIRGHLDTLDKSMGMRKGSSSKPLEAEHARGLESSRRSEQLARLAGSVRGTNRDLTGVRTTGDQRETVRHLARAELQLGSGAPEPGAAADAYHHLHEAHRTGVEDLLSQAETPEEKQKLREFLDKIQGHMEALDQATGSDPKRTQQLLGGVGEQNERAQVAKDRQAAEKNAAPNWMAPGRRVIDPRFVRRGVQGAESAVITKVYKSDYDTRVELKWNDGQEGSYSLDAAKELLQPAPGEQVPEGTFQPTADVKTGMEGDFQRAQVEALVGQPVVPDLKAAGWRAKGVANILGGKPGVVTDIPDERFDMGAEEWTSNNDPSDLWVNVLPQGSDQPVTVPASALALHQPEPPKGAQAVHPQLGGHLVRMPGDTISQRNYGHVPRPVDQPAPITPSTNERALQQQLGQATQRIGQYAQRDQQRREEQLRQNLAETRARELEARGIAAPGTYQPLTDEQFAHHIQQLEEHVADALSRGLATDQQYALDKHGTVWTPDRSAQHRDIIKDFLDKTVDVPSQRQAIMLGGLSGAGKSTLLKNHEGIDPKDYAVVNTDHFKEELARRGMVPEVPGLSPLEASALVHNESAYLHDVVAAELQRRGKNIVFDGTMRHPDITRDRVEQLKKRGYNVGAMFVDTTLRQSLQGVESRYRRGLEEYRAGRNPLGGRHVPRSVVMSSEASPGRSQPRDTFERLKSQFTWWERHDASSGRPRLAERSTAQQQGTGIPSVEELRRQMGSGTYTGATEAEVRAREKGTNT